MSIDAADLKLSEIRRITSVSGHSPSEVVELCDACILLIEQSDAGEENKQPRREELMLRKCIALVMLGHAEEARSVAGWFPPEAAAGGPLPAPLLLADAARRSGEWERVLALTEEAEHLLTGSPAHRLELLSKRCEALLRFPERYEEGVETAKRGRAIAAETGHLREEAALAVGHAGFLQLLCRYAEAKTAAEEAVMRCRRAGLHLLALKPMHVLAQSCLDLGDPDAARRHALAGYEQAVEGGLRADQIEFLQDFAEVALVQMRPGEAMGAWMEGIPIAASVPVPDYWLELAGRMREMMLARKEIAMAVDGLDAILKSTVEVHPGTSEAAVRFAIDLMKDLYIAFGKARAGELFHWVVGRALARRQAGDAKPGGSAEHRLLVTVAVAVDLLAKGEAAEAFALADGLDRAAKGHLRLRSVLEALEERESTWTRLSRWFSGGKTN